MDNVKLKAAENVTNTEVEGTSSSLRSEGAHEISKSKSNTQKSATIDKDLDVFLLGDPEDSDDGPGAICLTLSHYCATMLCSSRLNYLIVLRFLS